MGFELSKVQAEDADAPRRFQHALQRISPCMQMRIPTDGMGKPERNHGIGRETIGTLRPSEIVTRSVELFLDFHDSQRIGRIESIGSLLVFCIV